jgi:hypothetical protein
VREQHLDVLAVAVRLHEGFDLGALPGIERCLLASATMPRRSGNVRMMPRNGSGGIAAAAQAIAVARQTCALSATSA